VSFTGRPRRDLSHFPANLNAPVARPNKKPPAEQTVRLAARPCLLSLQEGPTGPSRTLNPMHRDAWLAFARASNLSFRELTLLAVNDGEAQPQKRPPVEHEVRLAARPCLFCHLRNATSFRTRKLFNCNLCLPHKQAYDKNKLRKYRRTKQRVPPGAVFRFAGLPGQERTIHGCEPGGMRSRSPAHQEMKGRSSCCGSQLNRSSMQNLSSSSSTGMGYLPE
jgi:hypothetical protein